MGRRCTSMETNQSPPLFKSPLRCSYCRHYLSHGRLLIDIWCWLIGHSFVFWIPSPYAFTVTCSFPFFESSFHLCLSLSLHFCPRSRLRARPCQKRDILKTQKHITSLASPEYKRMEDQGSRFLSGSFTPPAPCWVLLFIYGWVLGYWLWFLFPLSSSIWYFCYFSVFSITSLFHPNSFKFQFFYAVRFSVFFLVDIFRCCHRPLSWHTRSLFLLRRPNSINTSLLFSVTPVPPPFS